MYAEIENNDNEENKEEQIVPVLSGEEKKERKTDFRVFYKYIYYLFLGKNEKFFGPYLCTTFYDCDNSLYIIC
jgi:hypothetical protein